MPRKQNISSCKTEYSGYAFLSEYLVKDLERIGDNFSRDYPFIDTIIIKAIIAEVSKKINTNYAYNFIDRVVQSFPYLEDYRRKLEVKYVTDISSVIRENCSINIVESKDVYDAYEHKGEIYYINKNGDLYDDEHIYVGFVFDNRVMIFKDIACHETTTSI